jgi:hypothetical protein
MTVSPLARLDSVKRLTWGSIDAFFVGMHVVVVYFGIAQCLQGLITPATVFNFTVCTVYSTHRHRLQRTVRRH